MALIILSLLAIFLVGIFWVLKKMIGISVPPILGVLFIYFGGFVFTFIVFFLTKPEFKFDMPLKKGLAVAIIAGILVASFDILCLMIFKKGGDLALFAPVMTVGSILLIVVFGVFFFKESITLVQVLGILTITGGIFLVAR